MCDLPGESYQPKPPQDSVSEFSQPNLLNQRYRILKPIGQGGFGKTFLAVDENQEKTQETTPFQHQVCVIKQFFPQRQSADYNKKASELFHQESLSLAELGKHPQIPQLLDTFEQDGQQYLVQEWINGQTLEQELLEAGAFNELEIRQLLQDLLPVLQFIHEHNCIHRDIKPANIIRRQQNRQLVLIDFGASKYSSGIPETTGTLIGSPEYAAPEQIQGKAIFASDLYSLGITCLHLLTQMPPFDLYDCSEDTWIWEFSYSDRAPHLIEPISPSLERIFSKLLQRATKRRYQSAAEVLADLNVAKDLSIQSQPNTNIIPDAGDFETYFGFTQAENLPTSTNSIAATLPIHDIAAVTIFDPQMQAWYYLPPKMEGREITKKVATFLNPRQAAATSLVEDEISKAIANQFILKTTQIQEWIFRAVFSVSLSYLIINCFALVIKSYSHPSNPKVESIRIYPEFLNPTRK